MLVIACLFVAGFLFIAYKATKQEESALSAKADKTLDKAMNLLEKQELRMLREERARWEKHATAPAVATAPVTAPAPAVAATPVVTPLDALLVPRTPAQATKGLTPLWLPEPQPKPRKRRRSAAEKREAALLSEAISMDAEIAALEELVEVDGIDPTMH